MKAIQDRHSILLCVQNDKTQFNQEAMQGVEAFKADPQYAKGTEIVVLNPADKAEQPFLKALQVDPQTATAVTLLVTPPGAPVARFAGAVTKEQIEATVKAGAIELRPRLQLPSHRRSEPCDCERLSCARSSSARANSHQLPGDPAGNHGDRVDQEHLLLLREGRGAGDGFPGGQRAGAAQVVHLAGLLRGRHAGRDHSRGIRHATGDVGPGTGWTTSRRSCRCRSNCRARPSRSRASCPRASFRRRPPGAGPASSRGPSAAGPRSA